MIQRRLGTSGLVIAAIGFGTMGLGGRYERDESRDDDAIRHIQTAIGLGANFLDSAEVYGAGHTEELIGKAIAGRRHQVVIATKFSASNSGGGAVIAAAEASLRRLGTDYIDLYQSHWPNPRIPVEETMAALAKLVEAGKIRAVGLSNATVTEIRKTIACLPEGFPLVSVQQEYSLLERFVEYGVLPFCRKAGLALIAYSPLGQGRLGTTLDRDGVLSAVADRHGLTSAQVALQWVARQEDVIAIPMTSRPDNLRFNMTACDRLIDAVDMDLLSQKFRATIEPLPTDAIEVVASHTGKAFNTLAEARANELGLSPSPTELAVELAAGDMLKPVKVRPKPGNSGRYQLYEGQLRYWAWVIAHGGQRPIMAFIEQPSA